MTPLSVCNNNAQAILVIEWPDGAVQRLPHRQLRQSCPCAFCRSARQKNAEQNIDDVRIVALNPMGYGLQLIFSDGHDRGIFPWLWLSRLSAQEPVNQIVLMQNPVDQFFT